MISRVPRAPGVLPDISPDQFNKSCNINSNLLVVHVNISSLPKNFDALEHFILNLKIKPYVILVSETWLDNAHAASFALDGYSLTSLQQDVRGKGTAII